MQKYLITTTGFDRHTATTIMTAALFVFILFQPIAGILADKIGTKTLLIIWSILSALFTFPGLSIIGNTQSTWVALFVIIGMLFIMSMYTSISGVVKSAMFPASVRALGVSLSHAIGNALFGGSAEYVALELKNMGHESLFYFYITGIMIISFIALLFVPDMSKGGYLQDNKTL